MTASLRRSLPLATLLVVATAMPVAATPPPDWSSPCGEFDPARTLAANPDDPVLALVEQGLSDAAPCDPEGAVRVLRSAFVAAEDAFSQGDHPESSIGAVLLASRRATEWIDAGPARTVLASAGRGLLDDPSRFRGDGAARLKQLMQLARVLADRQDPADAGDILWGYVDALRPHWEVLDSQDAAERRQLRLAKVLLGSTHHAAEAFFGNRIHYVDPGLASKMLAPVVQAVEAGIPLPGHLFHLVTIQTTKLDAEEAGQPDDRPRYLLLLEFFDAVSSPEVRAWLYPDRWTGELAAATVDVMTAVQDSIDRIRRPRWQDHDFGRHTQASLFGMYAAARLQSSVRTRTRLFAAMIDLLDDAPLDSGSLQVAAEAMVEYLLDQDGLLRPAEVTAMEAALDEAEELDDSGATALLQQALRNLG